MVKLNYICLGHLLTNYMLEDFTIFKNVFGDFGWILGIHHLQRSRSWRWNRPNSWVMWNIGTFANPWNHQEVQIDMDVYDVNIEKYSKTTPLNSWSRPNSSGNWERSFSARMYCLPGTSWGMAKTGVFHVQNHPASLDMRGALQHVVQNPSCSPFWGNLGISQPPNVLVEYWHDMLMVVWYLIRRGFKHFLMSVPTGFM